MLVEGGRGLLLLKTGLSLSRGALSRRLWMIGESESWTPATCPTRSPLRPPFHYSRPEAKEGAVKPHYLCMKTPKMDHEVPGWAAFKGAQRHRQSCPPAINLQHESCHRSIKLHNTSQAIASHGSDTDCHFLLVQFPLQACSKSSPLAFAPSSSSSPLLFWA